MSMATDDSNSDNPLVALVVRFLVTIRRSFLAFVATMGVAMLLIGAAVGDGVGAGILGVIGVSAVIFAIIGLVVLRLIGYN